MTQNKSNSKPIQNSNGKKNEKPQNAYFLSLELENVRCFGERQKVNFSDNKSNPRQWTIILGDNGTGKTTLLRSIISLIPIPADIPIIKFNSEDLDNIEYKRGFLANYTENQKIRLNWQLQTLDSKQKFFLSADFIKNVKLTDKKIEGVISKLYFHNQDSRLTAEILTEDEISELNIFGYGASRKTSFSSLIETQSTISWESLFYDDIFLPNPEEWLLQSDYSASKLSPFRKQAIKQLEKVKEILLKILPDADGIRFDQSSETPFTTKVEFHTPYGWVESRDLSLGYRTSMAWMVDFASRMFDRYPKSENPLAEPAVVLIDEIDLHLHPKWQRELLDYLSNLFPNTQFIVTTHSPLIVQSAAARDANIVVCRREGDHVVIDQSVEAVRNWRADQILTSDLFGLETARPKEIEPFLEEREKILSKAKLTKKDEKRLTELENEIGVMPVSENSKDDKAMDIIRRAAERLKSQNK